MSDNILRKLTTAEQEDMKDIRHKVPTPRQKFMTSIEEANKKASANKKPFCIRCARMDFNDKYDNINKEMGRVGQTVDVNKIEVLQQQATQDLKQYEGEKRFAFVKVQMKYDKGANKMKVPMYYYDYVCTKRGCGVSIEHTESEHNAIQAKKNKVKNDNPQASN